MKISIITIGYNNCEGMKATLNSVATQRIPDGLAVEHIIVDGGSTDGSVRVIQDYQSCIVHSQLSITLKWVSERDKGIYNAMNKGIEMATGEYCLFLNSGDIFARPDVLQRVADEMSKCAADIYYGDVVKVKGRKKRTLRYKDYLTAVDFFSPAIAIHHQAAFIKRTLFESVGLYREDMYISADWYFFFQAVVVNKCATKHISMVISICNMDGLSNTLKVGDPRKESDNKIRKNTIENFCKSTNQIMQVNRIKPLHAFGTKLMWRCSVINPLKWYIY